MDHRRLQRALFRMQLDPGFAARLRVGDAEAARGLAKPELELLLDADARAVSADRDGRRAAQFLANVASEFPLSCAAGLSVDGFTSSAEFHDAVCADASLLLALARYASRRSGELTPAVRALVALEAALVRARRELRRVRAPGAGEVALAPWAWAVTLPEGTLALATDMHAALDRGAALPAFAISPARGEILLLRAEPEPKAFRLRAVEVEALSPALGALLLDLHEPRVRSELNRDADEVVAELLADRVLVAG